MKIDWLTVVAQALNFLILLWLMQRFLYKPNLLAIDEREKLFAGKTANAEKAMAAAQKQKKEYDLKSEEQNRQSAAFLKNAREEGQAEKLKLLNEARVAADEEGAKRRSAMVEEEKALRRTISRRTQDEVLAITRKVLADFAGTSLEERVVAVFNQRLRNLDEAEIKILTSALRTRAGTVTVRTVLEVPPELRESTEASIKEIVGSRTDVKFETAPELISGIELSVNGQKWPGAPPTI